MFVWLSPCPTCPAEWFVGKMPPSREKITYHLSLHMIYFKNISTISREDTSDIGLKTAPEPTESNYRMYNILEDL